MIFLTVEIEGGLVTPLDQVDGKLTVTAKASLTVNVCGEAKTLASLGSHLWTGGVPHPLVDPFGQR